MATIGGATGAGPGCGGIEHVKQVDAVVVECGQQCLEILIERRKLGSIDDFVDIEFRRHGYLLATFDQDGILAIAEVELGASIIGGFQHLAFLECVSNTQLANVSFGITRPGAPCDRNNRGICHDMTPCFVGVVFRFFTFSEGVRYDAPSSTLDDTH